MKYKPGDKVKIKSLDWYNANKNEKGIIPCGDYNFTKEMTPLCGKIVTIKDFEYDSGYIILEDDMVDAWTDDEKANKLNITLFEDQFIHFGQIVGTWAILTL